MLEQGDKVPKGLEGILVDPGSGNQTEGKTVKLEQLWKNNMLILYFYPKDNTPGCTTEGRDFQAALQKITKSGATVAGCSRDNVKSHCKFIDKLELDFPLLSDESGVITDAFGVWVEKQLYGKKFMGIQRSTFVIDKGVIIKSYPKVKVKTHVEEILEYLKQK